MDHEELEGVDQPESPEGDAAPAKAAAETKPEKFDHAKRNRELEREIATMRGELNATREWFDKSRVQRATELDDPDAEEETEENDPVGADDPGDKVLEEFSTSGIKSLVSRGLVTKKMAMAMVKEAVEKHGRRIAREVVGDAVKRVTRESQLIGEFPELKDEKSELFAKTREIFQAMVGEDPSLAKSPGGLKMAAALAKERLNKTGQERNSAQRQSRIDRQGERGSRSTEEEGDDYLGDQERSVIDAFKRYGVTDDNYREMRKDTPRRRSA